MFPWLFLNSAPVRGMPKVRVHIHSAVSLYQSLGPFYRSLKEYYQQSVGKDLDKEQSLKTKNIFFEAVWVVFIDGHCTWRVLFTASRERAADREGAENKCILVTSVKPPN